MIRILHRTLGALLIQAPAAFCSGCLSIGGKLAIEDTPARQARLPSLEARMTVVEQSVGAAPAGH